MSINRLPPWLTNSLNNKFVLGTTAGLVLSSLVFLVLFVGMYRAQIEHERTDAAANITGLLQISLENAMLKHDLPGLREIVRRLGEQGSVHRVLIANPAGIVRFASDPEWLGEPIDLGSPGQNSTSHLVEDDGARVLLRNRIAVLNKEPCQTCHGPITANPVNGVLVVDYDARSIRERARDTTLFLMASGSLIVLLNLAGGWWFIGRFVLRPVGSLADTGARMAGGDLSARAALDSSDELGQLGQILDGMAEKLQQRMSELERQRKFLQGLVDAFPDGVRVIDQQYRVRLSNRAFREQLALPGGQALDQRCYADTHGLDTPCAAAEATCPLRELSAEKPTLKALHRHKRGSDDHLDVEIYASLMQVDTDAGQETLVVESIRDLERQVRFSHQQKLSELGRLAAGIAHEIHNPLTSVRMALAAAEEACHGDTPESAEVREMLRLVDGEVDTCIDVTNRLLKLSTPGGDTPDLVDVLEVLDDTLRLLYWDAESSGVRIELSAEHQNLRILASDGDLRMATLNLAQNALHAMPEGGTLAVNCRRGDGKVILDFRDTGCGIAAKDLPRIFEPFFSRRADGVRGTGLGLSITKHLVEAHGGEIRVDSAMEQGTLIVLTFPDADRQEPR